MIDKLDFLLALAREKHFGLAPRSGMRDCEIAEITVAIAKAMGYPMEYSHPSEIMDEIARLTPTFAGVWYAKLDAPGSVQWPCNNTGRILSPYNVGAQTRRTGNFARHKEDLREVHRHDAEDRGIRDGDWVKLQSRSGGATLHATISERVVPGVVYTTFHHPETQANIVTADFPDWATNCPEYKVRAVQVMPSNGPRDWRRHYQDQSDQNRQIAPTEAAE